MAPILLASVVSVTVFLERLWALRSARVFPLSFVFLVHEKVSAGEVEAARTLCEGSETPVARVVAAGLRSAQAPREQLKAAFEEVGRLEVAHLGRYLEILGTIATITPLLGLLGTVVGMIDVFRSVVSEAGAGPVNPASLASGIWSALLTTAAGLSAAIPAFIAYKVLIARVDRIATELEELSLALLDLLTLPVAPMTAAGPERSLSTSISVEATPISLVSASAEGEQSRDAGGGEPDERVEAQTL